MLHQLASHSSVDFPPVVRGTPVRYPIVHILGVPRLTHLQLIGPITNILIIYGDPRG